MRKLVAFALCAASLMGAPAANAAVVTFADRAAFEAAISGSNGSENFNSFAADATFQNTSLVAGALTISGVPGFNGATTNKIDAPALAFANAYSFDGTAELLGDLSPGQQIRIDFAEPISAFGADFVGIGDGSRNTKIFFYSSANVLLATLTGAAAAANSKEFYGIMLDSPAAYLILGGNTSGIDVFAMDNVAFKVAEPVAPQVPLPGTFALFAAGLAGLGFAAKRRRA